MKREGENSVMRTSVILRESKLFAAGAAITSLALQGAAQERDRDQVPEEYKWNLADVYPTIEAWRAAKETLADRLPEVAEHQGRLGSSAAALADALDSMSAFGKELARLRVYAGMLADQDSRDATHEGMRLEMVQLGTTFGTLSAHLEPEILRISPDTITRFVDTEPRLAAYRFFLEDLVRRAPHTLSDREEKILAAAGPLAGSPSGIHNILSNADFPYPIVALSEGGETRVTPAAYTLLRRSPNRQDRETVMSAFFDALGGFSRTFGTIMNASVQKALFFARARQYPSSLEMTLDGPRIPVSVYTGLIESVNRHLPSFHRYLRLRKRVMRVDELHYYDLYAPLVDSVTLEYQPDAAREHVLAAVAPLGPDYTEVLQRAFDERWLDWFPTPGKRSGAYSQGGAYDVHPYILMNYNGRYDDMSTLAHELGHTMHSYYSNQAQPYWMSGYPIFVAEVASTFNESLLMDHMLETITDDATRLSLLGNYVESIKGTVFRQTQFAEFELRMHEMAAQGQPITGDALAKLYLGITKRYYGHDAGVSVVDDYIAHEWSYIPHFYREFYVFQYATSFTASEALAQNVKEGDAEATKRYLGFLAGGGSQYPIDLLRDAGVDMTTGEPLDRTMKEMNRVMDEMERLLATQPASAPRP